MKNLLNKLLDGTSREARIADAATAAQRDNSHTIEDGSENAARGQLVKVLLQDALRKHGIPDGWIDCQMMRVASRSRGDGLYVRLVVKHWDDRLMNYSVAFQKALLGDIRRFEPQAASWLHGILWQMDVTEGSPCPVMPEKSFWLDNSQKPASSTGAASSGTASASAYASLATEITVPADLAASSQDDALQDLERLFQIRDHELSQNDDGAKTDFAPTRPNVP